MNLNYWFECYLDVKMGKHFHGWLVHWMMTKGLHTLYDVHHYVNCQARNIILKNTVFRKQDNCIYIKGIKGTKYC